MLINNLSEINGIGEYEKKDSNIAPKVIVDTEDEEFIVAVDGIFVTRGYKLRKWKTITGLRNFLDKLSIEGWYNLQYWIDKRIG